MNCQDITRILNDGDLLTLTTTERHQIDAHLAECADCSGAWLIHNKLAVVRIPEMPEFLTRWRPVTAANRRTLTFVVPFLLLTGAATALVYWQSFHLMGTDTFEDATQVDVMPIVETRGEPPESVGLAANATVDANAETVESDRPAGVDETSLAHVLVLPTSYGNAPAAAITAIDEVYRSMLRELQTVPRLDLVLLSAADIAFIDPNASEREQTDAIAGRFGEEIMVGLAVPDLVNSNGASGEYYWGDEVTVRSPPGGVGRRSRTYGSVPSVDDLEKAGVEAASMVIRDLGSEITQAYYKELFLDSRRPEAERLESLRNLAQDLIGPPLIRPGVTPDPAGVGLPQQIVEAAIELARTAVNPDTRQEIWFAVSAVRNPALVQPLLGALLYDEDADVRRAAVSILEDYRADSVVMTALEAAASSDSSSAVRMKARWSLLTENQRPVFVSATLLDAAMSPEEKVDALKLTRGFDSPFRREAMIRSVLDATSFPIEDRALDAVVDLAATAADSSFREVALRELGLRKHAEFVDLMQAEADPKVRRMTVSALNARAQRDPELMELIDQLSEAETDPEVRAELERVSAPPVPEALLRLRDAER